MDLAALLTTDICRANPGPSLTLHAPNHQVSCWRARELS